MKEFTFKCSNCKREQKVYSNVYLDLEMVGCKKQLIRFTNAMEFAIKELGWAQMTTDNTFNDFLCPKCK